MENNTVKKDKPLLDLLLEAFCKNATQKELDELKIYDEIEFVDVNKEIEEQKKNPA